MREQFGELLSPTPLTAMDDDVVAEARDVVGTPIRRRPARRVCQFVARPHGVPVGLDEREDQRDAGLDVGQGRLPGHLARDRRAAPRRSGCRRGTSPATCTRSRTPPSARPVTGESHAWVEWWDGGWNGFDPTNSVEIGTRHVTLGRGRDYGDVPPFKGLFSGATSGGHTVTVEVTRLA